jgi:hypothetical protein
LIFVAVVVSVLFSVPLFATEYYIVLHHSGVNIRTGPDFSRFIVGEASKGELYHYQAEEGDFYEIEMFTGAPRYISKSLTSKLEESQLSPGHSMELTQSEAALNDIYGRITKAKERAERESGEILPGTLDEERNRTYRAILADRYILQVFRNQEVQPALYQELMDRCTPAE